MRLVPYIAPFGVLVVCAMPLSARDDPDVRAHGEKIISDFADQVRACGIDPQRIPTVTIVTSGPDIRYNYDKWDITLSSWPDLPDDFKGMMQGWADQGTLGLDAEGQFREIFNDLLVPHEMGHWLAHLSGSWRFGNDFWEAENEANRIAIAYLLTTNPDQAQVANRISNFTQFLATLPSPVLAGEDPATYFNENYETLGDDPTAYGWYQGAFMQTAWDEAMADHPHDAVQQNSASQFCRLVIRNAAPTSEADVPSIQTKGNVTERPDD